MIMKLMELFKHLFAFGCGSIFFN